MAYGGLTLPEQQILAAVSATCEAARHFYQHAAQHSSDSNLRYHFTALATLHHQASQQLAASGGIAVPQHKQLAAIQQWYLQQAATHHLAQPAKLTELSSLLQQQLAVMKQLSRTAKQQQMKTTLAHLSAALQMATDSLFALLQVLPGHGQKIQTKN